jgi:hypothetical protein
VKAALLDDFPILVDRVLAKNIGLNEAIVIQQLHYWIMINKRQNKHLINDRYWIYNTLETWQKDTFYFWSIDTVKRTFKKLEKNELIITANFNKKGYDRTKWYTINYEKLASKCCNDSLVQNALINRADCTNPLGQNAPMEEGNLHPPIPKTTTETNTKTSFSTTQSCSVVETNKEIIESKTHLKLSNNMKKIVSTWDKERLSTSIEIFNEKQGQYFSLLQKIYKDDGNFVKASNNSVSESKKFIPGAGVKTRFHENCNQTFDKYTPEELEKLLQESQKGKFN